MHLADLLARLDANRPQPRPAHIKGVGDVFVMPLTVGQVDTVPDEPEGETKKRGVARSIAAALCDEQGVRYGVTPELVAAIEAQSWEDLQGVRDAIEGKPVKND